MKIEFIISHYKNPEKLITMIGCLMSQTSNAWSAHFISDGPYYGYEAVKNMFISDSRFKFSELDGPNKDFGNTPRNWVLPQLREEWVVMTGHDNYYVPMFVELFLKEVDDNVNFVYSDLVHNWFNNDYIYLNSRPEPGAIDMGNFMTRSKYASQLVFNAKTTYADSQFVQEYIAKFGGEIRHIPKALYVHN